MLENFFDFLSRHESFILTTHDNADADGLGAELVCDRLFRGMGKTVHILNAEKIANRFVFMDPGEKIAAWDQVKHGELPEKSALLILDTSDEYHIGCIRDLIGRVRETFVIDHHEPNQFSTLSGLIDSTASSTCEIAVEVLQAAGLSLDQDTAAAAFAGLSYDTGSFAYIKTTARSFRAALFLIEAGVHPYTVYRELNESASTEALLLRKLIISTMEIHAQGRIAGLIVRKEFLESTGANIEDAEAFINVPLMAKKIVVSIMVKENREGNIRCSLRSKGAVNVSKIAQQFGGGGHVTAAGFRSKLGITETLRQVLEIIEPLLEKL
ncbi:MAG: bifunctional oligoribonuclease/PAP phosphatase NrnA [Treponema sp.]|jgi:phosphoesterase RecJ-like protein|nr:bifunctional oligoribonuclease/PAP phosphatase NrnA [Treponema sp.]